MCNFLLFLSFFIVLNTKLKCVISDNNLLLAENFFVNLYSDPFLENAKFSESSKEYIDDKVETFLNVIKEKGGQKHSLQRRSIDSPNSNYNKGIYTLKEFKPLSVLQNKSYIDAVLFGDDDISYIASLEQTQGGHIKLGLYKYNEVSFKKIYETSTVVQKMYTVTNKEGVFLVTVEKLKIHIHQINTGTVDKIQTIDASSVSDIYLWNNKYGFFMAVATNITHLGTSHIYKWFGKHFDLVDKLESLGAIAIKAFTIGSSEFIAIANSKDEYGQNEIFSTIFKYNVEREKYEISQKIATIGAKGLVFSSFFQNGIKENFLITINSNKEGKMLQSCLVYKFVDSYFMPYEGLAVDLPEDIIIISMPNQEQLLGIFSQTDGLKVYTYNGWIFDEVKITSETENLLANISSIKTAKLSNKDVLLIQKLSKLEIIEITFSKIDTSKSVESNIINWCQANLNQLESGNYKLGNKLVQVSTPAEIVTHQKVNTARLVEEHEDNTLKDLEIMDSELSKEFETLKEIDQEISNSFTSTSEEFIINQDIFFDELIVNGTIVLEELHTHYINDISMHDILSYKIDVDSLQHVDTFQFENVLINNISRLLNGKDANSLINFNDIMDMEKFVVGGNVVVRNDTVIFGYLNNEKIQKSNVFVNRVNQTFYDVFTTTNLKANNVTVMGSINNNMCNYTDDVEVRKVRNLNVQSLNISYFINNVDIRTINEFALKVAGDQHFAEPVTFDTLISAEININESFVTLFGNFLKISNGTYNFDSTITFNDIEVNELIVNNNINNVGVKNGKLDILRNNVNELQEVMGNKIFKNINIALSPPSMNNSETTAVFIEDQLILNDSLTVQGNIFINNILNGGNMKSQKSAFGLANIGEEAFKLTDEEISSTLIFAAITVDNINTSYMNNIPINDFVKDRNHFQVITGAKRINSDIYISGYTKILSVNDVSLQKFENDVLTIFGEQTLIGKYYVNRILANNVSCANVKLASNSWEDISKTISWINSTVIVDSLEIQNAHIDNLMLSKINGVDLQSTIENIVTNETQLFGNKAIGKVYAKNVYSKNNFNMDYVPYIIKELCTNFILEDHLRLNEINVENINVQGYINDVDGAKFTKEWMQDGLDREFDQECTFHNVTILGESTIQKNNINGLHLKDLFEDTVKVDENHEFEDVTFDELLMVFESITLHGNIVGLDLDSTVTSTYIEQSISGFKTFERTMLVNGSLKFEYNVGGMNIDDICEAWSNEKLFKLIINGNAVFVKNLQVDAISSKPAVTLINNLWLNNRMVNLTGYFKFQNVTFQNDLLVEGLTNDIDLGNLVQNYFSISKNQTVFSHLDFTESVNFFDGLKADEMLLVDSISGIRLNDIVGYALLDGYSQIFDATLYANHITVEDLNGEYLLNNMDLQKAIRYNIDNLVLGQMNISNLTVNNLIASNNIVIQNVNISKWLQQAVLKSGGSLQFCNFHNNTDISKELGVVGLVNGKKFNNQTVLLKSLLQTVTGNILFNATNTRAVHFNNLKLKSLNGIDLYAFIKQMVSNNEDLEITSPISIKSPIYLHNLEIKQLHNGVNVTNLLNNLTSFNFDNFYDNYAQLLNVSKQIQYSLDSYPKYVNHFELIQTLNGVMFADIVSEHLMIISFYNNQYSYQLYMWDIAVNNFRSIHEGSIPNIEYIEFIGKISVGVECYMYTEDRHFGYITKFSEENTFELIEKLPVNNNTQSLHSFQIIEKKLYCVILISHQQSYLYCKANGKEKFSLLQTFATPMNKASSLIMNEETFLMTSTQDENYVTIWQYHTQYEKFTEIQHIYVASPCSISTISFKKSHYLAIASGNIEDAIYSGSVQIERFHPSLETFVSYQAINIDSPKQVEFAILPSNELVLYVLTNSVSESFFVYEHKGVFGLNLKSNIHINAGVIKVTNIKQEHVILAQGSHQLKVIRGFFKSQTYG